MVVGFALGGAVFTAVLGQPGLGATPATIAHATDTTLLVSAGLAILATLTLMCQPMTEGAAFASWTRKRLAQIAWSTRQA
jgi:hypothetical protein